MRRSKTLVILVFCCMAAAMVHAGSVEEARQLYRAGDELGAREALIEILALETSGVARAQALDLVAMIAVDKGDLELAAAVWEKLIREAPDSPEAVEARSKLSRVRDLSEAQAAVPEPEKPIAEVGVEPATPTAVPTPTEKPTQSVVSESAKEAAPAAPAAPAEPRSPSARSELVLVAGRGSPHDGAQRAAEVIIEYLQAQGVAAESATKGIPVVEKSSLVIPALLRQVDEEGANSLLLVSSNFESLAKVVAECYTPEGLLAWKKKVSGGTGWKGRPYSATGMNENLVNRMIDKLAGQVGDPCLPLAN